MDPVAVFNALYDTKCLKFGRYDLKSGLVAPYYMNLRRLTLYPEIMEAVVSQVVDKYLSKEMLKVARKQKSTDKVKVGKKDEENLIMNESSKSFHNDNKKQVSPVESDADSQLTEEEEEEQIISGNSSGVEEEDVCYQSDPIICGVPYGAIPLASAIAYRAKLPYLFERKEAKSYGDKQSLMEDFTHQQQLTSNANSKKQRVILIEDVICSGESILDAVKNLDRQQLKVDFVICIVDREENGINLLLEEAGIKVLPLYNMSAILRILETTGRITSEQFINTRQWMQKNQFKSIGVDPTVKKQQRQKVCQNNITNSVQLGVES